MALNLFDNDDDGFDDAFGSDDFGDGGFDNSDFDGGFNDTNSQSNNNMNGVNNGGFNNSDDMLNGDDSSMDIEGSGNLKKTAIIMAVVGVVIVIGVFCLARVILNKDNKDPTEQSNTTVTEQATQPVVQQTTVNADELMGSNSSTSNNAVDNTNVSDNNGTGIKNFNDDYWISINGADQIAFSEPQEVKFHITEINHYIAQADGSDNYVIKSTLRGSISGYGGSFYLDVPYDKGTLLQVGQEFTVYITTGTWNGKTVIGEIKY